MGPEELENWLKLAILEVQEELSSEQITPAASLFHDLGFDSLALERLLEAIESAQISRDLTPWYASAAKRGQDTVGSLLEFLLTGRAPGASGDLL